MTDDRVQICETVYRYATGIDTRNWELYRSIFTDEIEVDFSSYSGEPAARMKADDWVRTVFRVILTTHITLAVVVVPLIQRTFFLATRERFSEHRRLARITFPIWLYVAVTGLIVYAMNNHLRPPL